MFMSSKSTGLRLFVFNIRQTKSNNHFTELHGALQEIYRNLSSFCWVQLGGHSNVPWWVCRVSFFRGSHETPKETTMLHVSKEVNILAWISSLWVYTNNYYGSNQPEFLGVHDIIMLVIVDSCSKSSELNGPPANMFPLLVKPET